MDKWIKEYFDRERWRYEWIDIEREGDMDG